MTLTCINLLERFGERYRIGFDEAAESKTDPWEMTVPCRSGTIYPHGGEILALELNNHPKIAKQVRAIPGIVLHQDGDDEETFLFPVSLFDQVAALVEPKKVRKLGEEHKAKLLAVSQKYWFKDGSSASSGERQAPEKPSGGQEVA